MAASDPRDILRTMTAVPTHAYLGGRDHGAIHLEKQVVAWFRIIFKSPAQTSGLVVSGKSIAALIALNAAGDRMLVSPFARSAQHGNVGWLHFDADTFLCGPQR